MTGYGTCCDRRIVAMNWKFCPFCGGDLIAGFKVPLRAKIATGMDEYLTGLDTSGPSMNWSMKKLRLLATAQQLTGRSKMTKAELVESLRDGNEALFDF